jgi:Tol biopolymer transport system component
MERFKGITIIILLAFAVLASAAQTKPASVLLQEGLYTEEIEGNLEAAIQVYERILKDFPKDRPVAAKALLHIGLSYEKLGKQEAQKAYRRVIQEFADQQEVAAQARKRLAALGGPGAAGGPVTRRILADVPGIPGIDAILTPDGKYISHIDPETGDMVQLEIASGQRSRITNKEGAAAKETPYEYQAFSRDGKQIAYDSYTKDSIPQLRIRNLDGSGLRTLYSEKGYDVRPLDWSPDAGSILASRELDCSPKGGIELTLISTADGSVRVLRSITSQWVRASFSPDGRFVAFSFVGGNPPNGDVFLMTADGRDEVVVARHPAEDQLLGWAPNGRSLLFFSDRAGTRDIWAIRIASGTQQGEPELLKKDFGQDSRILGLAPDGSLYYETHSGSGRLYTGELDLETGRVLVPPVPVKMRYTTPAVQLTWSPDGRNLAYLSHPGRIGFGNNILTIRSAATGEERFLSPRLRGVNQISWAPDGRAIIALGFTETDVAAFRIDAETSAITKLAGGAVFPRLCPDGKILVFYSEGGIRKHNLDTGEESEVVKTGGHFDLSPDGREVVFQEDGVVKTVSLDGGEPRELFRGLAERYQLSWTRDGRYIIARSLAENHEVWRIPAQGGTPLKLDLPNLLFFALHPDSRRFAYSDSKEAKSELWVMENFLPEPKPEKPSGMVVRRVWAGAWDPYFMGAPSPDGKYVSYVDWRTGDLGLRDLATGTNRKLTSEGWEKGWAQHSVFSPDGKQLAYYWWNSEKGEAGDAELRIVGLDGSGPRVVHLDKGKFLRMPAAWSADGKQILALGSAEDRSVQILLIPVVDGKMRVLKTLPHYPWLWRAPSMRRKVGMSLSPDGRYVAYTYPAKQDSPECDIFLLAVDGSGETALVEHPADDFVLGWVPDGRNVVFASDRMGSMGIWAIELADGKPQGTPHLLKPDVGLFHPMGLTPNGSYYYGVASGGNNIYVAPYDPQTGNVTSEPVLAIKQYEGSNGAPDWSPDGRYLACVSKRPGAGPVFLIHSVETGQVRELSPDLEEFDGHSLRWFPDGRSLLGAGRAKDFPPGGILRIDAETGKATTIVRGGLFPEVASDSKTIFDVSRGHNGWWIWRHDLTTGEKEPVFRAKVGEHGVGGILGLALSPDGKQLAFQDLDAGMLKVLPVTGGQPRELVKVEGKITIAWTPDGSHVLYANWLTTVRPGGLWRISTDGGEPQRLNLKMGYVNHVRFHPDGRRIAFTARAEGKIEVWVMENFLPELNDRQ